VSNEKLKLVVATNFSRKSERALDFALQQSQNANADIYLFHVFETKTTDYRELDRINVESMERMKQAVMQALERHSTRGVRHSIDEVHRRVSHGKAWVEILSIANGVRADMIIMGAPTTKNFRELITKSPCSLVLVKDKELA
jgi:nucleotide-binding universal stress UspA family protein